jgi:peroxiredoxin Q/BCP
LRDSYPKLSAKGEVVAISFEDRFTQQRFKEELRLPFPLLADPGYRAIDTYAGREPNRIFSNPAAYIIDTQGKVRFTYLGKNPSDRPPVDLLLKNF